LGFGVALLPNPGYGTVSVRGTSASVRALLEPYSVAYRDGKKRVSVEWLDGLSPLGLAWWFMDDGSKNSKGVHFHTEGYSEDECALIVEWFRQQGFRADKYSSRDYWFVRLHDGADITETVEPYIIPEMRYKLVYDRVSRRRRRS